jgi:DNA-directed RNA polymerase sigma subunit (sigma70/sigma32)
MDMSILGKGAWIMPPNQNEPLMPLIETVAKLVRVERRFVQETGREPTLDELAATMQMSRQEVGKLREIARAPDGLSPDDRAMLG